MKKLVMKQVDAFTTEPFGGNPAGVLLHAEGIAVETMQRIASELSTLESAFVSRPTAENAAHRVRFFSPSFEYDFSGHAMLATCLALAEEGMVRLEPGTTRVPFETNIGIVPVDFYFQAAGEKRTAEASAQSVPLSVGGEIVGALERIMIHRTISEFRETRVPSDEVAKILGIPESEIRGTGLPAEIVFGGISQLVVPVRKQETLVAMRPDLIKLRLLNRRLEVLTTDVFTLEPVNEECTTYSRHFSPAMGMWEDPASGAGASSIATYLVTHGCLPPGPMIMEQGPDLTRLARVIVDVGDARDGAIPVQFGGLAATSITREISIENDLVTVS